MSLSLHHHFACKQTGWDEMADVWYPNKACYRAAGELVLTHKFPFPFRLGGGGGGGGFILVHTLQITDGGEEEEEPSFSRMYMDKFFLDSVCR